ncbi:hypothetical protein P7C73_g338, partial [Tremellales sp. Uapishka_1]
MPNPPIASNATLHALTERLASHSKSLNPLHPLMNSNFAASLTPQAVAAAASAYRQPAPPPQLPLLQLLGRHQEVSDDANSKTCPYGPGLEWPERGTHNERRSAGLSDEDLDGFVLDMGMVLRREFDVWVEQCWTEAFHHLFTHTLPTLLIHLILTGSSPNFLRRQIVHGGANLDNLFKRQMLDLLYQELELRLSGARPRGESRSESSAMGMASAAAAAASGLLGGGFGGPPPAAGTTTSLPRDGVCFHNLAVQHARPATDDDHAACLCQLTSCPMDFQHAAINRKGPVSLLPFELADTSVAEGWCGSIESESLARARQNPLKTASSFPRPIPEGRGFVKNPKPGSGNKTPPLFPHPQMTDVLAVEEHLRWRLKEMGAADPAVESRYGPSTNSPAALEGVDLPDVEDTQSNTSGNGNTKEAKIVKVRGKGKLRRVVERNPGKNGKDAKDTKEKGRICYLPKEWAEAEPPIRNMAIVLTYRHFVKLLHQAAISVSPFSYPSYPKDVEELQLVHPVALYRRLAEPSLIRRKTSAKESRQWQDCMDKWAEELGAREKTQGNIKVNEGQHAAAVEYYTRAISLDSKKTVYFSNRAVALNTLGAHERAEADCKHILSRDSKNGKAFYQRALARRGLERWREAESDLREVLRYQPGNESAKKLMAVVKAEVGKLPKLKVEDVMDF